VNCDPFDPKANNAIHVDRVGVRVSNQVYS